MRIFVSSPSDLAAERRIALQVLTRLRAEFKHHFDVRAVLWEHEPLLATEHFQEGLISPADCDVMVCLLWARLGSPLPERFRRTDGTSGITGTEWEFLVARDAAIATGKPELLVYRNRNQRMVSVADADALHQAQREMAEVDAFFDRHFHNDDAGRTFKAAYWSFTETTEFEDMLVRHLTELLRRHARAAVPLGVPVEVSWHRGSPFMGLRSFDPEHAEVYFGRNRARNLLLGQFLGQAAAQRSFVMVVGASGSGKSSLVKAGVLPILTASNVVSGTAECRWCVWKPSDHRGSPIAGLLQTLLAKHALPEMLPAGEVFEHLRLRVAATPHALETLIYSTLGTIKASVGYRSDLNVRLLLVIDQFEEFFTSPEYTEPVQVEMFSLLAALVSSGHTWVIGTLRSDFYAATASHPDLVELMRGNGQFQLAPPTADELDQMIRLPAQAAGLRFERDVDGHGLDSRIRAAAGLSTAVLPLLSFTLDELYERRSPQGVLTFEAYTAIGGLEGAIARRADAVYAGLDADPKAELSNLLAELVSLRWGDSEVAHARVADWDAYATNTARRALVDALVAARLVVAEDKTDDSAGRTIRLAHEALLQRWGRVHDWIAANDELLRMRSRVNDLAHYWNQERRPDTLLLQSGRALELAPELLAKFAGLDANTLAFVEQSLARQRAQAREQAQARVLEQRNRRRRKLVYAAAAVIVVAIIGIVVIAQRAAQSLQEIQQGAQREAHARELSVRLQQAESATAKGEQLDAVKYMAMLFDDPQPLGEIARTRLLTLAYHLSDSLPVAVMPDNWHATSCVGLTVRPVSDGEIEARSSRTGETARLARLLEGACATDRFVGIGVAGTLDLWGTNPLARIATLGAETGGVEARFAEDGNSLQLRSGANVSVYTTIDGAKLATYALQDVEASRPLSGGAIWIEAQQDKRGIALPGHSAQMLREPVFDAIGRIVDSQAVDRPLQPIMLDSVADRLVTWDGHSLLEVWQPSRGDRIAQFPCGSPPQTVSGRVYFRDGGISVRMLNLQSGWAQPVLQHSSEILDFQILGGEAQSTLVALTTEGVLVKASTGDIAGEERFIRLKHQAERMQARADGTRIYLDSVDIPIRNADAAPPTENQGDWALSFESPETISGSANVSAQPIQIVSVHGRLVEFASSGTRWLDALDAAPPVAVGSLADSRLLTQLAKPARAAVSTRDALNMWDLVAGKVIQQLPGTLSSEARFIEGSSDQMVVTTNGSEQRWQLAAPSERLNWLLPEAVDDVAVTADLSHFWTIHGQKLTKWTAAQSLENLRSPQSVKPLDERSFEYGLLRITAHPKREEVVLLTDEPSLLWVDRSTLEILRRTTLPRMMRSLEAMGNGDLMLCSGGCEDLYAWNDDTQTLRTFSHWAPVTAVLGDAAGGLLTATSDGVISRWVLQQGEQAASFANGGSSIHALGYRNGRPVAIAKSRDRAYEISHGEAVAPLVRVVLASPPLRVIASTDASLLAILNANSGLEVVKIAASGHVITTIPLGNDPPEQDFDAPREPTLPDKDGVDLIISPDSTKIAVRRPRGAGIVIVDLLASTCLNCRSAARDGRMLGFANDSGLLLVERERIGFALDLHDFEEGPITEGTKPVRIQLDDLRLRERAQFSLIAPTDYSGEWSTLAQIAADEVLYSHERFAGLKSGAQLLIYDFVHDETWVLDSFPGDFSAMRITPDGRQAIILAGNTVRVRPLPANSLSTIAKRVLGVRMGKLNFGT